MNEIDSLSEMIDDDTGVTHYRLTCVGGSVNVVDTIIRFNTKNEIPIPPKITFIELSYMSVYRNLEFYISNR